MTGRFPTVTAAITNLPDGTVLDGDLVIFDAEGCPDFTALMRRRAAPCPLAFDMPVNACQDLCTEPVEDRKRRLADLVSGLTTPMAQNTDWIVGEGRALFEAIRARGMEGMDAKRLGCAYTPGRRGRRVGRYAPDRRDWFNGREQQPKEPAQWLTAQKIQ